MRNRDGLHNCGELSAQHYTARRIQNNDTHDTESLLRITQNNINIFEHVHIYVYMKFLLNYNAFQNVWGLP